MEEDEFLDDTNPSGVYFDIGQYLDDKFAFPGTDDPIKGKQPAEGFDQYLNDRFGE